MAMKNLKAASKVLSRLTAIEQRPKESKTCRVKPSTAAQSMTKFAGESETIMDDVDRLFQCFKCGVSPPQSAVREKREAKRKLKQHTPPKSQGSPISANKCLISKIAKQFSPVVFYGSPNGVPPKRPARLLKLLREIRIDLAEQSKQREDVWATFPRQDDAMKFAKQHGNVRLFSYQDHINGQRRFLVSTYKEFWRRYKDMSLKFRHHYEVIQEALPCHLYFDLEYNIRENADKNGDEMVDLLLTVIFDALLEKYSIQGSEDFVVELDSSTEDKFSRHLIIRLPKAAFKDNSHAGSFVAEICSRIHTYRERDKNYDKLLISKGGNSADSDIHLFVDSAVYSRNRCFRLPFSSKAGKNSFLLPTGRFKCKDMSDEEIFMASLICNLDADSSKLLICKMDLDCVKALHFETEISNDVQKHSEHNQHIEKFDINAWKRDPSTTCLMEKSPFPALDAFIKAIASTGNVPGKIQSWCWFSEYALIVYTMSRNRYCERIGREHKSNHVIYVVDLRRAVYYQKCHDPDCRGYRSPLREVPDGAIPDPVSLCNLPKESGNQDQGGTSYEDDAKLTDSGTKKDWWLEAVRVAEEVEVQKTLDLTQMDETDEDENWWMAAVNTASETELTYLQKSQQLELCSN